MIFGKYINKYYIRYLVHFLIGAIALIFVDLLQIKIPQIIGNITDNIIAGGVNENFLMGKALYLLLIGLGIGIGRFLWRNLIFGASRNIEYHLRNDVFRHLEKLSANYFNKNKTGDLMAHVTNDINAIRMSVGPGLLMVVDAIVLVTIILYNMAYTVDIRLTLIAIIPFPLIIVQGFIISKFMKERFREKQEAFSHLTDMVQESLSGIRVIKAFVQGSNEIKAFAKSNKNNFDKNIRLARLSSAIDPIIRVVVGISLILTIVYGGRLTMYGEISLGELVAFIDYLGMLVWPMIAMGMVLNVIAQGKASLDRVEKILDEKPEIFDSQNTLNINNIQGAIKIRNLSFRYPNSQDNVLENINIDLKEGETLGIIGRTGSGKSTLVNLLLRIYNVEPGQILIDNTDIMRIPLKTLRENIGFVPQDNFLFSDTVERNIAFGDLTIDLEKIEKYSKLAAVHDNIIDFKEGYKTIVGERGVTLSGGQKQRISIARALIKEPKILILDDALSAVDTDTEERILKAIKDERYGKTTIIISHRVSTIKHSNEIILLDEGKIIERGTHQELVQLNGQYNEIVKKQQLEEIVKNQ